MHSLPSPPRRVRLFVDWDVQSSILIRCAIYGVSCVIYLTCMVVCTQWTHTPEQPLRTVLDRCAEDILFWLPGLLILIPLATHDLLKTSGRFAGPVVRLQSEMKLLLECQSERPIQFRKGDYWPELASTYNQIRGEVLLLRRRVAEYEAAALSLPFAADPLLQAELGSDHGTPAPKAESPEVNVPAVDLPGRDAMAPGSSATESPVRELPSPALASLDSSRSAAEAVTA
jgi:hypothetical protein